MKKEQVPKNKTAMYASVVVNKRPEKEEVNRTRITAGGDQLEFQGDTSTETAGLESPWKSNQSPPAVIRVRFTSSFSGRLLTTTLAYVAVLSFGTWSVLIQNSVFVPFIC